MNSILGLLAIFFILIIIFQIGKATDMISFLNEDSDEVPESTNKTHGMLFLVFGIVFLAACFWSAWHYRDLYLPYPSSEHGVWIRNMFFWTMVVTVPVFVVTHILLFWFSYKYSKGKVSKFFYYPENNRLEMLWTAIPAVVLIFLVVEGIRNWTKITSTAPDNALVVEVTGKRFDWTIRYSGKDNKIGTKSVGEISSENALGQIWSDKANHDDFLANELHLPLGQPVLVKINAIDVLHSFYLPHFRVKMDAVPGIPTQFWFIPTKTTAQMREELKDPNFEYEMACAELCGAAHFNMRKVVIVETPEEFQKWLATQKPTYNGTQTNKDHQADARKTSSTSTNSL